MIYIDIDGCVFQMSEKCPEKVAECQQPKEYARFGEEFLIDIRATIAAMEEVCPVAQKKSLKMCPVFGSENIPNRSYATASYLQNITFSIASTDVTNNTPQTVTKKTMFENIQDEAKNKTNIVKANGNSSVILFEDIKEPLNLFWNLSENSGIKSGNLSMERDILNDYEYKENNDDEEGDLNNIEILLLVVLAIAVVVVAIVCVVFYSRSKCSSRFKLGQQKFIRRL